MNMTPDQLIQALSDQTRLRCVLLLRQQGELCVCELMHALNQIQPKISRHLALLRESGVVNSRRQGQWIYYQLRSDLPAWGLEMIDAIQAGAQALTPYCEDIAQLQSMPNRPGSACSA